MVSLAPPTGIAGSFKSVGWFWSTTIILCSTFKNTKTGQTFNKLWEWIMDTHVFFGPDGNICTTSGWFAKKHPQILFLCPRLHSKQEWPLPVKYILFDIFCWHFSSLSFVEINHCSVCVYKFAVQTPTFPPTPEVIGLVPQLHINPAAPDIPAPVSRVEPHTAVCCTCDHLLNFGEEWYSFSVLN